MRLFVLLGLLISLTACSHSRMPFSQAEPQTQEKPQKAFAYGFKAPKRAVVDKQFSQQLDRLKQGDRANFRQSNKKITRVKLGKRYFSASGYECRKITSQTNTPNSACKIGKRWYTASPVFSVN